MDLTNPSGTVPNACSVTVKLKPQCTLKCREKNTGVFVTPCVIAMGQDVDLEWTTRDWLSPTPLMITTPVPDSWNVAGITPAPTPFDTPATSSIAIDTFVNPPITYTMTLQSGSGVTNTCSATTGKLPSCTLTATPPNIVSLTPQTSTLTWAAYDYTGAVWDAGLAGGVAPLPGGTRVVAPAATTTYTIKVSNALGDGYCSTVVNVAPGVLPTCTLTAVPTTITTGMGTTLIWTGTNAASATINNGVGLVAPPSGGDTLGYPTSNLSYTMTVTSTTGHTNTCTSPIVTVNPLPIPGGSGGSMKLKEFTKSAGIVLHDTAKELLKVMGGLALLVFVMSGIFFMFSRGEPEGRTKAKKMLLYAILGLIVILLSYAMLVLVESLSV